MLPNTRKSLLPYLLPAAGLHLWLLAHLRLPAPPDSIEPLTLTIQMQSPAAPTTTSLPPPRPLPEPHATASQQEISPTAVPEVVAVMPPASPPQSRPPVLVDTPSPMPQTPKPALPSYRALLDAASKDIRQSNSTLQKNTPDNLPLSERPSLPQLAKQLAPAAQPKPGTTQYADGSTKVVTAYGTVYCTQTNNHLPAIGPVDPTNLPMTCP